MEIVSHLPGCVSSVECDVDLMVVVVDVVVTVVVSGPTVQMSKYRAKILKKIISS